MVGDGLGCLCANARKGVIKTTRGRREKKIVANQVTLNEQSYYIQEEFYNSEGEIFIYTFLVGNVVQRV